jgi:SAM-dependent methyltransferase
MRLGRLERDWHALGLRDPMWAILSAESLKGGGWEERTGEFYASGVAEIENALIIAESAVPTLRREAALDFGCGIGRVTRALAEHFDHVVGVDVAPSMVERAQRTTPGHLRCEFLHNPHADLRLFPDDSFDLVYTRMVLQHIPRHLARRYVAEFIRLLRPGGCALFQMTSAPLLTAGWRRRVPRVVREAANDVRHTLGRPGRIRVFSLLPHEVVDAVTHASGSVLHIRPDDAFPGYQSFLYAATKAS